MCNYLYPILCILGEGILSSILFSSWEPDWRSLIFVLSRKSQELAAKPKPDSERWNDCGTVIENSVFHFLWIASPPSPRPKSKNDDRERSTVFKIDSYLFYCLYTNRFSMYNAKSPLLIYESKGKPLLVIPALRCLDTISSHHLISKSVPL